MPQCQIEQLYQRCASRAGVSSATPRHGEGWKSEEGGRGREGSVGAVNGPTGMERGRGVNW